MLIKHRVWLRALTVMVALGWLSTATAMAQANTPTGSVAGQLVDPKGQGIAGAAVDLLGDRGNESLGKAVTQSDGRFLLDPVPVGCRMRVIIDAEGFGREHRDDLFIFPQQTTDLGRVIAFSGSICRGRVVDAEGQPLSGVELTVQPHVHVLGHTIQDFGAAWRITTGADGRFATVPLPPSLVSFSIRPPRESLTGEVRHQWIGPGDADIVLADVVLQKDVPIEGVVVDSQGRPLSGAEVRNCLRYDDLVKTDDQGRFSLRGASAKVAQQSRIVVEAVGYAGYFEDELSGPSPRKIVLAPCRYVSGRAIDAQTGDPVTIRRVVVCDVRREPDGSEHAYGCGEAVFDQPAKGQFKARVSTPGKKHVTILADDYHPGDAYVLEPSLEEHELDLVIKLRRKGTDVSTSHQSIRGVVRHGNQPAPNVWVSLWMKKQEWSAVNAGVRRGRTVANDYRTWREDVLTAADGSYLLDVSEPGDYYVVARPLRGAWGISPSLAVAAEQRLVCDVELPPGGSVGGKVVGVDPEIAQRLWAIAFGRLPYQAAVPVDRNGDFFFPDVPPSEIGIKVGLEGYLDVDVLRYPWSQEDFEKLSQPWQRAKTLSVEPSHAGHVELDFPPAGPPEELD